MQRNARAYLNDILEAATAIQAAVKSIDEDAYADNRLIRSAVEREFIIIGEALKILALRYSDLFAAIPAGRQIIDFRNTLTHEYRNVSNRIVWGAIQSDLPELIQHASQLLDQLNQEAP